MLPAATGVGKDHFGAENVSATSIILMFAFSSIGPVFLMLKETENKRHPKSGHVQS